MGKQSRRRAERHQARQITGRPTSRLRELFLNIRQRSSDTNRRAWELMLEILAVHSGFGRDECLSAAAKKLLPDLGNVDALVADYIRDWDAEMQICDAVSDPIGTLLEEHGAANQHLDQFFTPPSLVRFMGELTYGTAAAPEEPERILDPCCGTGRFGLDALLHRPKSIIYNVDIDLWMVRAAMVNFRLASRLSAGNIGRTRVICADSLVVDLSPMSSNWNYSGRWNPPRWESTMKMEGFDGTYEEFQRAKPKKEVEERLTRAATKRHAEQLDDLALDEATLHAHMRKAVEGVGVPPPPEGPKNLFGEPTSRPAHSALPLSHESLALNRLRGRRR
jgi:hypothetical protein